MGIQEVICINRGREKGREKVCERERENLHTLPLVHKLVGERISGLTLHNIRFSCFIGKGNGWDLSWPAQDKRQTKKDRYETRYTRGELFEARHYGDEYGMHGRSIHTNTACNRCNLQAF